MIDRDPVSQTTEHDTDLLKPCPFCGSPAMTATETFEPTNLEEHLVQCGYCTAQVSELTSEAAIVMWNRRAGT